MSEHTNSSGKSRTLLKVLCAVLAVVLVVMLAGTLYVEYLYGKLGKFEHNDVTLSQDEIDAIIQNEKEETAPPDFTGPSMNAEDVTFAAPADVQIGGEEKGEIINILLMGQDRRPGEVRARTDTLILCTFNTDHKTLTLTSFMRDTYVRIPGYGSNRINVPYLVGGLETLDATLMDSFGIHVDGHVEVDFTQFSNIVDLLGGVDVEISDSEAWHLNNKYGFALQGGMQHLNGEEALEYARIRSVNGINGEIADFGRTNRQRTVINAMLQAYKNSGITKILGLMDDILPMVTTDMSTSQLTEYVMTLFPMLAECEIITQRIPQDGAYQLTMIDGMSVLLPDLEANRQLLVESLSGE